MREHISSPKLLAALLVVGDAIFTIWAIGTGLFSEVNPVALTLITMGIWVFIAVKVFWLLMFYWSTSGLGKDSDLGKAFYGILIGCYSAVMTSNVANVTMVMLRG